MIDSVTLFVTSLVTRGSILLVLIAAAMGQPTIRHMWHWITALSCSLLGLLLLLISAGSESELRHGAQSFSMIMASLAFSWSGLRLFYGRRLRPVWMLLLTAVPLLSHFLLLALDVPERFALSPMLLGAALYCIVCIGEIVRAPERHLFAQYTMAVAFTLYCIGFLVPALLLPLGMISTDLLALSRSAILIDQVGSIIVCFGYITANSEYAAQRLRQLAQTDTLTGLKNRRGIWQALQAPHHSLTLRSTFSVVLADLDHFKSINDQRGHDTGDRVLQVFSQRLRSLLRREDIAARWGGEEFLILLPDTDIEEAMVLAERLRRHVAEVPFVFDRQHLEVTLSLGAAQSRSEDRNFESTIQRADRALYHAKQSGRNRACRYQADMPEPG